MVVKKTATKKVATKKTAAKKTAAKKTVAKVKSTSESTLKSMEDVASEVLKGKWGSGRDRDDALRQAGYDPAVVSQEANRQRVANRPEPERIARSRRGASWM